MADGRAYDPVSVSSRVVPLPPTAIALVAFTAARDRSDDPDVAGGVATLQVAPPSVVRMMPPPSPTAQPSRESANAMA